MIEDLFRFLANLHVHELSKANVQTPSKFISIGIAVRAMRHSTDYPTHSKYSPFQRELAHFKDLVKDFFRMAVRFKKALSCGEHVARSFGVRSRCPSERWL